MSSRRNFLQNSATLLAGGSLLSALDNQAFAIFKSRIMPSDQLNIGAIGINGMGWSNVKSAVKVPGVNIVALCDVDKNVLDKRLAELGTMGKDASKVKTYGNYKELLANKDVDAVIIGTPDHWHALIMVDAVQAGKHVYVEKPVGNSIEECKIMVAAQERYGKIVQGGQWQRSQKHFRDAVDYIRTGKLGNIRTVKVWCYQGWMKPGPVVPDTAVPAGVNYDMWLGPAKKRPFNESRFHFNFRWFWDYAGGLMTDWGVHLMDYAIFGMDAPVPKTISALGGPFAYPELYQETPDTMGALYEFPKFNLIWDHAMGINNGLFQKDHGIAFIGNNGTLELDRGGWEVIPETNSKDQVKMDRVKPSDNGLDEHWKNFVGAVKSGKQSDLNCPIATGAHIAKICQMGNIAFRSQQKLTWDKDKDKFTDEKINKEYLAAKYSNGYKMPKV
ncbi:MAG: Gfo/Idh/MocA family oxidoreductase [Chitinophagaceae bacterium]|nr:MAG: Gfo/Idh/MocA family oxidoreductase [Chitinophagaceae bacterium]